MSNFIGIDVHKDACHATVQDESGEIIKQDGFANSPSDFEKFFDEIDEAEIVIEAGGAWQPVYDWLHENDYDVKLAHPKKTRIIAEVKIKTDYRRSSSFFFFLFSPFLTPIRTGGVKRYSLLIRKGKKK